MERAPLAAFGQRTHLEVRLLLGGGDAGVAEQVSHDQDRRRTL
jgi:hypothetical protein